MVFWLSLFQFLLLSSAMKRSVSWLICIWLYITIVLWGVLQLVRPFRILWSPNRPFFAIVGRWQARQYCWIHYMAMLLPRREWWALNKKMSLWQWQTVWTNGSQCWQCYARCRLPDVNVIFESRGMHTQSPMLRARFLHQILPDLMPNPSELGLFNTQDPHMDGIHFF